MFSSVKLLTGPPVETVVGSPVEPAMAPIEPAMAPVEPDNAPAEPNKRRRTENDREWWFRGYGGGMDLSAAVGTMIKWKQRR